VGATYARLRSPYSHLISFRVQSDSFLSPRPFAAVTDICKKSVSPTTFSLQNPVVSLNFRIFCGEISHF
jgi:hypothetical protein